MFKSFFLALEDYVKINKMYFIIMFLLFFSGLLIGLFTLNGLSLEHKKEISDYLVGFSDLAAKEEIDRTEICKIDLLQNGKLIFILWGLGVCIIGIPFIFLVILIRGFVSGFAIGAMVGIMQGMGGFLMVINIFIKDLIIIPPLIGIAVNGINFSGKILKRHSIKTLTKENIKHSLIGYCILTIFFTSFIVFGVLVESYITPLFMKFGGGLVK